MAAIRSNITFNHCGVSVRVEYTVEDGATVTTIALPFNSESDIWDDLTAAIAAGTPENESGFRGPTDNYEYVTYPDPDGTLFRHACSMAILAIDVTIRESA